MQPLEQGAVIDLHTHTHHSDGTESPTELVHAARAAGVRVLALTDHDVSTGWAEADRAGAQVGVGVVPGIEVSCSHRGASVHLLAYLPDPDHEDLAAELERCRDSRRTRLSDMVDLLAADGYPVTHDEVREVAGAGATLGRPHLADVLVRNGVYPDRDRAFAGVLAASSPYYVSHHAPDPARATELVVAAGGVPVMAHPFAGRRGRVVAAEVLPAMVEAGLVGIEVDHRDHGTQERAEAARAAKRFGLLPTGSSDYHGQGKPNRLGENTTSPEVLASLLARGTGAHLLGDWG
ncbi:PHP domain-containing protein [Ornithinimicrobium sp. Y1847]|uniref:PHP domain-containing protein n=1 Tax=unclassified Ornithinimicrobium TaxID=2615080 RepID=UPI003B67B49E